MTQWKVFFNHFQACLLETLDEACLLSKLHDNISLWKTMAWNKILSVTTMGNQESNLYIYNSM